MAEKPPKDDAKQEAPADAPSEQGVEQPLVINAQYTKDLSFEAPEAPGIFAAMQEKQPAINVNVNVSANPLQEKTFEVIIEFQAECRVDETIAFILELEYAGIFTVNVPDEHLQPVLLIECPRLLFPFARNILADVSRDGGFPPLMLGPVDFASMFQAKLNELGAAQAQAQGGGGGEPPA